MQFTSHKITGDGIGSRDVVPTINLAIPPDFSLKQGVYAARVTLHYSSKQSRTYDGALHYGPRPTFHNLSMTLELHILSKLEDPSFSHDSIQVTVCDFIRPVRAFASPDDLKQQIMSDISAIKKALAA